MSNQQIKVVHSHTWNHFWVALMLLVGLPHEETGEGMKYEGAWEEGDPGFSEEKLWPATQGPQIRYSISASGG